MIDLVLWIVYFGIVVSSWGFYLVARIHAFKYKQYSNNINFVSNAIGIFMFVITVIGFLILLLSDFGNIDTSSIMVPQDKTINTNFY